MRGAVASGVGLAGQDLLGRLDQGVGSALPGRVARHRRDARGDGDGDPGDVGRAAARAVEAQRAWADAPYTERAAVLRRAGDLWHQHEEEITGWLMRETGSIGPFGGFQVMTSAQECYEASALAVRAVRRAAAHLPARG